MLRGGSPRPFFLPLAQFPSSTDALSHTQSRRHAALPLGRLVNASPGTAMENKAAKQSEGYSFGRTVAREVLTQARSLDRVDATRYVAEFEGWGDKRTVSIAKVLQTGGAAKYVVERSRGGAGKAKRAVAFADPKAAVRCFATSSMDEDYTTAGGSSHAEWRLVNIVAVPPGCDVKEGMPVLAFCPRAIDKTSTGDEDVTRAMTGTPASHAVDHAARMDELTALLDSGASAW